MANEIEIRITAQDNASAPIKRVADTAKDAGASAKEAGGHLGRMAEIAGGFVVAQGLMRLPGLLSGIVGSASDLNESLSKMNVVFGSSSNVIDSFAQSAAKNLGMSRQAAVEAAATLGNLFVAMKMGAPVAAEMSKNLLQLAADLASFNNLDPGEVLEKLRSGLVGETEPLRSLGVVINEAAVSAKGLAMGLGNVKGELSESEKVQARYALILEQTKTAQGDFARTADGVANSQRILKAEFADLAASLGTALLPAMQQVIGVVSGAVGAFNDLDGGSQALILGVAGIVAAVPPAVLGIEKLSKMFDAIKDGSAGAATKIGVATAAIAALTIASDVVLQKTTGHGLIEWIFGDPATADRHAEAIGRIAAKIQALGSGSDLKAVADEVQRLGSEFARFMASDSIDSVWTKAATPGGPAVLFRGEIDAIAEALKNAGASMSDWQRVMQSLPADLQPILQATSQYTDFLGAYINTQTTAAQLMEAQGQADQMMAEAMGKVAKMAPEAKGAIQLYIESLGKGEEITKNLEAALGRLADRFANMNPAVIAAKIELAAISEELDDAAASGRKWSDLFGMSIDALTKRQKDLEAITKAAESNATAFKGIADQLTLIIGPAGVAALDQAMAGVGKTLEQQVTTIEQIGLAFGNFAANDIPGIEKAFAQLKTNLTNQEWAVVGDALAAKFVEGFYQQTTGAGQQRILDAARKIGVALPGSLGAGLAAAGGGVAQTLEGIIADAYMHIGPIAQAGGVSVGGQMGAGIAGGLSSQTGVIAAAATSAVQAGLDAARRAMHIFSPSRRTADEIGRPMAEGIAVGILEGAGAVQEAMSIVVGRTLGVVTSNSPSGGYSLNYPSNPWGHFGASDALGGTSGGSWGTMPGLGSGNPTLAQFHWGQSGPPNPDAMHLTPVEFLRPWAPGDGSMAGAVFSQWRGDAPMSREQWEQMRWQQFSGVDPYAQLQLQFLHDAGIADQFGLYQYLPKPKPAPKYEDTEGSHYHDPWGLPADWAAQYGFGSSAGSGPAGAGGGYTTQPIGGITVVINIQGSLVGSGGINELAHAVQDELVKVFY